MAKEKYFAVVSGQLLLKLKGVDALDIVQRIKSARETSSAITSPTINPENFGEIDSTLTVVFPGPGMMFEVIPWDMFVEKQKQARTKRALGSGQQQSGIPILLQRPPGK